MMRYNYLVMIGVVKIAEAIAKHHKDKEIKMYQEDGKCIVELGKAYFKAEES